MGANATTSVPTYVAGQVLEAADLNVTNSGAPVFADSTARDAAFGGTGEKTLAEGQLCYLEDSNVVQYYDGSSWATVGPSADSGLTFVSSTTIGSAVSSVTVTGAFSATYNNYRIIVSGGTASQASDITLQLGATTSGYKYGLISSNYTSTTINNAVSAAASIMYAGVTNTDGHNSVMDIISPYASAPTFMTSHSTSSNNHYIIGNYLNTSTSYTAFTIAMAAGNMTGGTIKVYGYKD